MWPRKQLDIGWRDFLFGLMQVLSSRRPPCQEAVVGSDWIVPREAIVSLSVRTGWDLLLSALQLPRASEIIVSAITIPDMIRIIEHHGLVPVPVDVDGERLEISLEQVERAITPRTRAILVAHLFGARIDMRPIIALAERYGLLIIEDCAQAFVGSEYAGHADSDCAMFSFGPIKTSTALGGAVLRLRDPALRARILGLQRSYPRQSRWAYGKRLAKYAVFRLLSTRRAYGALVAVLHWLGIDYDDICGNAAHSFNKSEFFEQIRCRPCAPLLRMLQRRLAQFRTQGIERLRRRTARGKELSHILPGMVVGEQNVSHTYWVVPLAVANPREVRDKLRAAGFDATSRSSLVRVPGRAISALDELTYQDWLTNTVFVPNGDDIPDREWNRLAALLRDVAIVQSAVHRNLAAAAVLVPAEP